MAPATADVGADREQRVAKHGVLQFGEHGNAGREIHQPDTEVSSGGQVQELVAMNSERRERVGRPVQAEIEQRQCAYGRERERRQRRR